MLKTNQVIQIGEIEGNIQYYIEDYAYTFLKKQEVKEKKKYYLYGEKEETQGKIKLYIYGIGQKPKMEQTYFKEYYPLGFLKIKEEGNFWISLNGEENRITGVYVFYASNQAMQEYLVDYHKEEIKEEKVSQETKKRLPVQTIPMKEMMIPMRKLKNKAGREEKLSYILGGMAVAALFLITITSSNGRNKVEIFKQVIKETMSNSSNMITEEELIIEEKKVEMTEKEEDISQGNDNQEKEQERTNESDLIETSNEVDICEENIDQANNSHENGQQEDGINESIQVENNDEAMASKEERSDRKGGIEFINDKEIKNNPQMEEDYKQLTKQTENMEDKKREESEYEEYVVQDGDTLVGICQKRYDSLSKMNEICEINHIRNADYIAPGQKLYLP